MVINYQTLFRYLMATLSHLATDPVQRAWLGAIMDPDRLLAMLRSMIGWASWTEELSRYIFIWISYLAVSLTILTRTSIRVDVLHNALSPS